MKNILIILPLILQYIDTLNRVIEELFNYQNKLINLLRTKRIGERIPLLKTVILDK